MIQKTPFKTEFYSDRDRIRTYDRLLRRQMLYPAGLRDRIVFCFKLKMLFKTVANIILIYKKRVDFLKSVKSYLFPK